MEFTRAELLKIYVAMAYSWDRALEVNTQPTQEFIDLHDKIKDQIINPQ